MDASALVMGVCGWGGDVDAPNETRAAPGASLTSLHLIFCLVRMLRFAMTWGQTSCKLGGFLTFPFQEILETFSSYLAMLLPSNLKLVVDYRLKHTHMGRSLRLLFVSSGGWGVGG